MSLASQIASSIQDNVTQKIIAALESGVLPWRRPWRGDSRISSPLPTNHVTKKEYQGINVVMLWLNGEAFDHGYWASAAQWRSLGCTIKPGEEKRGAPVIFWSLWQPRRQRGVTPAPPDDGTDGTAPPVRRRGGFPILRRGWVYNIAQVDGSAAVVALDAASAGAPPDDPDLLVRMVAALGVDVRHGGSRAYYSCLGDYVRMPCRDRFGDFGDYAGTLLHEIMHWTEPRTKWDRAAGGKDNSYSIGELRAELGAAILASALRLPPRLENNAAYIDHWLQGLHGDRKYIFTAAGAAAAGVRYILDNFSPVPPSVPRLDQPLPSVPLESFLIK